MAQTLRLVQEVSVSNTSFEGGITGWTAFGTPATFAQSATQKHSGTNSLRIVGQTNIPRGGYIDITVSASTTYYALVWGFLVSGTFKLQADGDVAGTLINNVDMGSAGSTWVPTYTSFTTGASDTSVRLYILTTTTTAEGYFDDVRLYRKLLDFQDATTYGLREFSLMGMDSAWGGAKLTLDVIGSSIANFGDNMNAISRAMKLGKQNRDASEIGAHYLPTFLQFQPSISTNLLQTECFGLSDDSDGAIDKVIAVPQTLLSNRLESINLSLRVRGYWEELTSVSVTGSPFTMDANTGSGTIASTRGDLPSPLRIKVRTATTSQTLVTASLKVKGTPANFIHNFDLNSAAGTGFSVVHNATFTADRTDTDFINGKGARVTPTNANDTAAEISLLTSVIITTNPNDHTGRFRAWVRMRDNHASVVHAFLRVKSALYDSSNNVLGESGYFDIAKSAPSIAGTTVLPVLDCGAGDIPYTDLGGASPYRVGIEIYGYTTDSSHATFDLDELILEPCYEGEDCGYVSALMPTALGNGAIPDGVIDARDRTAKAYLVDASDVRLIAASNISGAPLMVYPNQSQVLFVHTLNGSNNKTTKSINNTVQVDVVPRYRLVRGS